MNKKLQRLAMSWSYSWRIDAHIILLETPIDRSRRLPDTAGYKVLLPPSCWIATILKMMNDWHLTTSTRFHKNILWKITPTLNYRRSPLVSESLKYGFFFFNFSINKVECSLYGDTTVMHDLISCLFWCPTLNFSLILRAISHWKEASHVIASVWNWIKCQFKSFGYNST